MRKHDAWPRLPEKPSWDIEVQSLPDCAALAPTPVFRPSRNRRSRRLLGSADRVDDAGGPRQRAGQSGRQGPRKIGGWQNGGGGPWPVGAGRPAESANVVATVNNENITRVELAKQCLWHFGEEVLERLVNKQLIVDACKRQNITIAPAEGRGRN